MDDFVYYARGKKELLWYAKKSDGYGNRHGIVYPVTTVPSALVSSRGHGYFAETA